MKKILFTLALCLVSVYGYAQRQEKFDPKEFQRKFEAFISEQANFTKEEATKFFALYNEMKDKERSNYKQYNELLKSTSENSDDKTITATVNKMYEIDQTNAKLESEYIKKIRKVISDRKYFLFKKAEMRFHSRALRERRQHSNPNNTNAKK